jgi:NhaP-type Na+/H+ or K+/H+ antiporter
MSTDDILLGLGLVFVLAVSSQLLAHRFGLPAIVVLLPAGFLAGIATNDVHPDALLGALYQPFVTIAVGIILFEAGLRLSFGEVALGIHKVVIRLIAVGVLVTWLGVTATVALLFDDMSRGVALLIGAILVVSGPTVVLPMLAFIRPTREVRSLLKWEGVLVDPIGALLGVLVFHLVRSGGVRQNWRPGEALASIGVGLFVGFAGATVLWLLLREVMRDAPTMVVPTVLMVVIAAVVAADLFREDTGFVAATLMGIALGNQPLIHPSRRVDVSVTLGFQETLVQLLVGVLFVLIAASVSLSDIEAVLPEALVLVAVIALVLRPAAVLLATLRSRFTWRERAFVAWMAPRGIVAGATASAFGLQLTQDGIAGAEDVLPIAFVAIFGTVVLYGLTAPLAARALGLAGKELGLVLVVGGHPWARELAIALKRSGVAVRMWVGPASDRAAAQEAGLDADRGRMMVGAVDREAELEEITDALLLTRSDDFNAIAAADLRGEVGHGHVYRVAPDPEEPDLLPPSTEAGILGSSALTFAELTNRFAAGARFVNRSADEHPRPDNTRTEVPLFAVTSDGRLRVATDGHSPDVLTGDTVIVLSYPKPTTR